MGPSVNTSDVPERLAAMESQLAYLVERQRRTEELFAEMAPVGREVMSTLTSKLAGFEEKGAFAFGRELVALGDRIMTGFTPDDVRQLGDAIVGILQTVRALTQPKVLDIANDASRALENAEHAEPIGLLGVVRATSDDDVKKGIAVMMEVMRHVGRAAAAVREQRENDPAAQRKAKLAATLAPRRKKALGTERTAPPAASPTAGARPNGANREPSKTVVIDGVEFGRDGHLADARAWSAELASRIAALEGVELDDARWSLIRVARAEFDQTGAAPNIRRITQLANVATKDVYTLFPKAPARTIAKIAGIPKPVGCI